MDKSYWETDSWSRQLPVPGLLQSARDRTADTGSSLNLNRMYIDRNICSGCHGNEEADDTCYCHCQWESNECLQCHKLLCRYLWPSENNGWALKHTFCIREQWWERESAYLRELPDDLPRLSQLREIVDDYSADVEDRLVVVRVHQVDSYNSCARQRCLSAHLLRHHLTE